MPSEFCWCCWPRRKDNKPTNPLEESLVSTFSAGGAPGNTDGGTATASPVLQSSGASTQRLLGQVVSSSCPNLHLLEQQDNLSVQHDKQHSRSVHAKPRDGTARTVGSPDIQRVQSCQQQSTAQTSAKKTQQQQQAIEMKPAQANPFLGVDHITADRSFVKARPGA